MELEWNVFYHNINKQEITTFNIFKHSRFNDDVQKNLMYARNKNEFAEQLRRDLQYYFWSRTEYEIIISPWCSSRNTKDIKVDIYTQIINNFNIFVDYIWSRKQEMNKHD